MSEGTGESGLAAGETHDSPSDGSDTDESFDNSPANPRKAPQDAKDRVLAFVTRLNAEADPSPDSTAPDTCVVTGEGIGVEALIWWRLRRHTR